MNFLEITSNDNWFKKHPEKIAGVEFETTSFMFPIQVKGTKEDVLRVTGMNEKPISIIEYNYFLTQRPPSIGTHPLGQIKDIEDVVLGKRNAYRVTYDKELSIDEIKNFELTIELTKKDIGRTFLDDGFKYVIKDVSNLKQNEISYTISFNEKDLERSAGQKWFTRNILIEHKEIENSLISESKEQRIRIAKAKVKAIKIKLLLLDL